MTDGNGHGNMQPVGGAPAMAPASPEDVDLVIRYNRMTGAISVIGPLAEGILFNGMLDMARVVFLEARARKHESGGDRVVPVMAMPRLVKP